MVFQLVCKQTPSCLGKWILPIISLSIKAKAMKTTRYFLIILGVMLLSIMSCEKPNLKPEEADYEYVLTEVEGHLMVRGSRDTIKNNPQRITLNYDPIYFGFDEPMTEINELLETYTDENGYYKLHHLSRIRYVSGLIKPEHRYYLNLPDGMALDETFRGEGRIEMIPQEPGFNTEWDYFSGYKGVVNQFLNKKAWIRLHIENVNPQPGDWLHIRFPTANFQTDVYGAINDTVILLGIGNANNALRYTYQKVDGTMTGGTFNDSIMLGEMDTTYYKFEY